LVISLKGASSLHRVAASELFWIVLMTGVFSSDSLNACCIRLLKMCRLAITLTSAAAQIVLMTQIERYGIS
jgi:hypothetical protein